MSATFETKINAIRTGAVGSLSDVIKRVEFTVKGTEQGQSFELPQTVELSEPDAASFKPLAQVTEADVVAWVEANFTNTDGVRAHIQYVLDRQVAAAVLEAKPLPWAPAPAPMPTPPEA